MIIKVIISCRVDAFGPEPISAEMLDGVLAKREMERQRQLQGKTLGMRKFHFARSLASLKRRQERYDGGEKSKREGVSNHSHWRLRLVISSSLRAASQRHLLRT